MTSSSTTRCVPSIISRSSAHEFAGLLDEFALEHVCDADATRLFGPREPAAVRARLDALAPLPRLQYLDFLTNCTYRNALICHRDIPIHGRPDDSVLRDCWVSLPTAARGALAAPDPRMHDVLSCLEKKRPESVAFRDLHGRGGPTTSVLLDAYAAGTIDVALSPVCVSSSISDYPTVSPLARFQAEDGAVVTNQKCEPVRLTELDRHVVMLLDGAHHRDDVAQSVGDAIRAGLAADDLILRLSNQELDAGPLTAGVLRRLRDRALLVG